MEYSGTTFLRKGQCIKLLLYEKTFKNDSNRCDNDVVALISVLSFVLVACTGLCVVCCRECSKRQNQSRTAKTLQELLS